MQERSITQSSYLWFAGISGTIMPLSVWLGGIRDFTITAAFLAMSLLWVLAYLTRNAQTAPVPIYKLALSGLVGAGAALLSVWFGWLVPEKNSWWILNYTIYLLYGLTNLYSNFLRRSICKGGCWLGYTSLVSIFLSSYSLLIIVLCFVDFQ